NRGGHLHCPPLWTPRPRGRTRISPSVWGSRQVWLMLAHRPHFTPGPHAGLLPWHNGGHLEESLMSTQEYRDHWVQLLRGAGTQTVDVLASLKEETINHILAEHFRIDKNRYTVVLERTFPSHDTTRTFRLGIQVLTPIVIDIPPFERLLDTDPLQPFFTDPSG